MKFFENVRRTSKKQPIIIVMFFVFGLIAASVFSPVVQPLSAQAAGVPENFSNLAKTASPAVVNIRTVKTIKGGGRVFRHFRSPFGEDDPMNDFFKKFFGGEHPRDFKQRSLGSGFIIDKDGYIKYTH